MIVTITLNPTLRVEYDAEAVLLNGPFAKRIQRATGIPVTFFTGTSFSSVYTAL